MVKNHSLLVVWLTGFPMVTGSNPDEKETACLEIEFDRFAFPVVHPQEYEFEELAHFLATRERRTHLLVCWITCVAHKACRLVKLCSIFMGQSHLFHPMLVIYSQETPISRQKDEETIREVIQKDPLAEISYQEKEILWKQRFGHVHIVSYFSKIRKCSATLNNVMDLL